MIRTVHLSILLLLCCLFTKSVSSLDFPNETTGPLCRERGNELPRETFRLTTCASCYYYLFLGDTSKELRNDDTWLIGPNDTFILADVHMESSRSLICSTLTADECERWESCCLTAEECCSHQLERLTSHKHRIPTTASGKSFCPQTWDGFGCWDFTIPGRVASGSCPEFIKYSVPSEKAYKDCTRNGTWYEHPDSELEWTDYSNCINLEHLKRSTITSIVCNVISLIALIPAVIIFTCYRPLRVQNRVILHINLFSSFILYGIVTILWDTLIVLNRIEHDSKTTYIIKNMNSCKFLYVLTRYSRMANFLWMFCEAVFLHRLLVKAFQPPKNLIIFYIIGWAFPWIPVVVYALLRLIFANTSCWIKPFGYWEWLIYVPNLLALFLNFAVLLDILRILVTQVQSHANELNSYRRALKATFILVPLFGLQLFLVIYRPPYHSSFGRQYETIAAFVVNLQGLFVALIFCLINGEVTSHLNRSWQKLRDKIHKRDYVRATSFSNATSQSEMSTSSRYGRRNSGSEIPVSNGNSRRSGNAKMAVRYERGGSVIDSDGVSCLGTDDSSCKLQTSNVQLSEPIGREPNTENVELLS